MKNFNELSGLELDTLREIGSIGTGNAATALSSLLQCEVRIEMPEVRILGYNEAIDWIGGPEVITAGVLVRLGGEINGIMLSVQQMDFINQVLGRMMNRTVCEYGQLSELDRSALVEVGNIMISTFVNALSGLAGVTIQPSVPGFAVDMQGAIITVPMAEFGGQSDYQQQGIGSRLLAEVEQWAENQNVCMIRLVSGEYVQGHMPFMKQGAMCVRSASSTSKRSSKSMRSRPLVCWEG